MLAGRHVGIVPSNLAYLAACLLLDSCSDETHLITKTVRRFLRQTGIDATTLLDVGCGYGRLFGLLSEQKLAYLEFVEPAPIQYEMAHAAAVNVAKRFRGYRLDAKLLDHAPLKKFDCVLISHVMYHIPHGEWSRFLNQHFSLVRSGGVMVVILWSKESELYRVVRDLTFREDLCVSEDVWDLATTDWELVSKSSECSRESIRPRLRIHEDESKDVLRLFFTKDMSPRSSSIRINRKLEFDGVFNDQHVMFFVKK
jgi:SAM-dependent methyltransferase